MLHGSISCRDIIPVKIQTVRQKIRERSERSRAKRAKTESYNSNANLRPSPPIPPWVVFTLAGWIVLIFSDINDSAQDSRYLKCLREGVFETILDVHMAFVLALDGKIGSP